MVLTDIHNISVVDRMLGGGGVNQILKDDHSSCDNAVHHRPEETNYHETGSGYPVRFPYYPASCDTNRLPLPPQIIALMLNQSTAWLAPLAHALFPLSLLVTRAASVYTALLNDFI